MKKTLEWDWYIVVLITIILFFGLLAAWDTKEERKSCNGRGGVYDTRSGLCLNPGLLK